MKTKQAISLIVLVITIIVMIILAGSIMLTLNNNGIIEKASDAVESTDIANMKNLATMLWAEKYVATEGKATVEELRGAVLEGLYQADPDYAKKYSIDVTEKGVDVTWAYLNRPYVYTTTDASGKEIKETYVFYEDGSVEKYNSTDWNDDNFEPKPCSFSSNTIIMGDKVFKFDSERNTLTCENKEYVAVQGKMWFFCIWNEVDQRFKSIYYADNNAIWADWLGSDYDPNDDFEVDIFEGQDVVGTRYGGEMLSKSEEDGGKVLITENIIQGHTYYMPWI